MTEPGTDSNSPWASDDVPVSDDAAPIVWELDSPDPATASTDADSATSRDEPDRSHAGSERSWRWPLAILGLLGLVVVGIVWRSAATSTDISAGIDERDPVDEVEEMVPDTEPVEEPETQRSESVIVASDRSLGAEPIELPDAVAAIDQPTEIIVRTSDHLIHTVSLPSGRVRTVGVPEGASTGTSEPRPSSIAMVASPTATLMAGYDQDVVITPRNGVPFVVDPAAFGLDDPDFGPQIQPIGWIESGESDQFLVSTFDPNAGVERSFSVTPDGVVSPVDSGRSVGFSNAVPARGHHVVNDAGGVYLIDADRTSTRISTGTVLAASETHMLLRECDEQRQCQFVLQSIEGDERAPFGMLPAQVASGTYGLSLSPDGTAVSYTTYGLTNERVLVDVADGPITTRSTTSNDYNSPGAWAPDGSGEFLTAHGTNGTEGLVFLDRMSEDVTTFGEELGQVVALAVRYPDRELEPTAVVATTPLAVPTTGDAPTGLRLVSFSGGGVLALLDLDDGNASTWTALPLPGPDKPQLFTDGGEVGGYTDSNGGSAFVAQFGEPSERIELSQTPAGPLYPGPDGLIWASSVGQATGSGIDASLVDLHGSTPSDNARQLQIADGTILGGDGRGGLAFESSGDIYASAGDVVERLTSGDLLAIGTSTALVRECDEPLVCDTFIVDRETGDRTPTGLDPLAGATGAGPERSVPLIGSMSPDGRIALVTFVSTGTAGEEPETVEKWFLFDLETGNPIGVEPPDDGQPIIWNDDSSYAVYVADGTVVVYEHSTGLTAEVTGTDGTRAITRVDAEFGPPESDPG